MCGAIPRRRSMKAVGYRSLVGAHLLFCFRVTNDVPRLDEVPTTLSVFFVAKRIFLAALRCTCAEITFG